jgi:methionine-rich copper-binding protein CopC
MTCRWVTNARLTTFGRRVVITSAVFGLTTVGSAGAALAGSGTVGFSPSAKVVAHAPTAVSVTFKEALRGGGARMRILTADGDVGTGRVTTGKKTLRRELREGAPPGDYTVVWQAVSVKGRKMSGTFSFKAARSNGEVARTSPVPSPRTTAPATDPTPTPDAAPTEDPIATAEVIEPSGTPGPSGTPAEPEWISGSDPIWTPEPTPTATDGVLSAGGSGHSGPDRSVSTGFTAVPLAVGGLLVLAAGMVSLVHRPRLRG